MVTYPKLFVVEATSKPGIQSTWKTLCEHGVEINCSIPPEFDGPGGGVSPEDFYASALLNCFIATFKFIAEKSKCEFDSIQGKGKLFVDRDEGGSPWMKKIELQFTVRAKSDIHDRILSLLDKTSTSCLIHNSVKTEKVFQFQVTN